uniref:Structure-specific endonuclease subunit SLX4 n=1 Tax=Cryptococcus gattii TaxID=552467 RepID=F6KJN8_CRYGA|nr:BSP1 [Cryptococcus gattii]
MPPKLPTCVSTSSTSSDEPVNLDCPPSFSPPPIRRRNASTSSATKPSNPKSRSEILVISDDDDEPEFIGPVLGGLAEKYWFKEISLPAGGKLSWPTNEVSGQSYKSSAKRNSDVSERRDTISAALKKRGGSGNLSKQQRSHALLPDLSLESEPVPEWLGRTSVLLQLQACPVCKVRWKERESGITRWRHMSTCRPPPYRPPNAPPDLQQLIHNALSARTEPSSLLQLHARSLISDTDFSTSEKNLLDNKKFNTRNASKSRRPSSVATITGLTSVTNVQPSDSRGEGWEEEVRSRVRDWIGPSSPSAPFDNGKAFIQLSPSNGNTSSASPVRAEGDDSFPPTQPFIASILAQVYPRPGLSNSPPKSSNSLRLSKMSPNRSSPPAQREVLVPASDSEEEDIKELEPVRDSLSGKRCQVRSDQMLDIIEDDEDACQGPFLSRRDSHTAESPSERKRSLIRRSSVSHGVFSRFSCLSIARDEWTLVLDEQDASLIPPKSDLRGKSRLFTPNPFESNESHTMTLGNLESPTKDEKWRDFDFNIDHDDAILTWEGNSSVHRDIWQEEKVDTPLESPWFVVDPSAENSKSTSSQLRKLVWGEEQNSTDQNNLEDICVRGEKLKDLCARGMPNYDSWDLEALKLLTAGYGYGPIKDQLSLVRIAAECWSFKCLEAEASEGSLSSAESISSSNDYSHPSEDDGDDQKHCKGKSSAEEGLNEDKTNDTVVDLHGQFYNMMVNDYDLYLRILHYQPIAFDELVSKAIGSGMTRRGWKKELKNYLDIQCITYFTEDPMSRRRSRYW